MISVKEQTTRPVKLETVVNKRRIVPADHLWVKTARRVGTNQVYDKACLKQSCLFRKTNIEFTWNNLLASR